MNLQSKIYIDISFKSKKCLSISVDIIFPVVSTGSLDFSNFEKNGKMRMSENHELFMMRGSWC
jgi:hypothetical protein